MDDDGETQASPKGGWIKLARSRRTSSTYHFHAMTISASQALYHNSRECLPALHFISALSYVYGTTVLHTQRTSECSPGTVDNLVPRDREPVTAVKMEGGLERESGAGKLGWYMSVCLQLSMSDSMLLDEGRQSTGPVSASYSNARCEGESALDESDTSNLLEIVRFESLQVHWSLSAVFTRLAHPPHPRSFTIEFSPHTHPDPTMYRGNSSG
ncbi:hypothetical protein SISNIDRAFT_468761 [Sistotremastrum niveocremeum HHB9708]|uniref:Uncharacterized protein n=1 Tax=Sistotremastrum niveocremeum HHB9708 TaxID=1314777 RepID=A0A164QZ21_9AGAM|nr:hypothetical protein SISNIDRAFT_468761 [Sistotremastrum niveocremeum HHB9708]